jgi:hypothetical protein
MLNVWPIFAVGGLSILARSNNAETLVLVKTRRIGDCF